MPSGNAAYCPACEHLLRDRDVVKRVGRHMDGLDPTFRCRVCEGEVTHPSRAPAGTETYDSGHTRSRDGSRPADVGESDRAVVVDGTPPLDVEEVRPGDRITVHYDAPARGVSQTAVGAVTGRTGAGHLAFETDTLRERRLDPGDGTVSSPEERLGTATRVRITR